MRVRRCGVLMLEPGERIEFDVLDLNTGGSGLRSTATWTAFAPHLADTIAVSAAEATARARQPANEEKTNQQSQSMLVEAYDLLLDRPTNHVGGSAQAELLFEVVAMDLRGFGADAELGGDLFRAFALPDQS